MTPFTLEMAIILATSAHAGQTDKSGNPYIEHPLRVMLAVTDHDTKIAAVLHDTIEDGAFTAEALRHAGVPTNILTALDALSRRPKERYEKYLRRVLTNPIAITVKRADVADNLSDIRMNRLDTADQTRLRAKYTLATELLGAA